MGDQVLPFGTGGPSAIEGVDVSWTPESAGLTWACPICERDFNASRDLVLNECHAASARRHQHVSGVFLSWAMEHHRRHGGDESIGDEFPKLVRTPDEIIAIIDDILTGKDDHDTDVWSCIWEIIDDILDSVKLAEQSKTDRLTSPDVYTTVRDYVINHYGD
jgi:hypothetical protein